MRGLIQNVFLLFILFCSLNSFAQSKDLFMKIWRAKEGVKLSEESAKNFEHFKNQKMEILSQIKELETLYYQELENDSENINLKKEILKLYAQKHQMVDDLKSESINNSDEALFLELIEHIRPKDLRQLLKNENLSQSHRDLYKTWLFAIDQTAIGIKLKDFELLDQNALKVSTAKLKGKIFWIDSWASKCGPCIKKLKQVQSIYKQYHPKGFEILAVSWDYTGGYMKTIQESKADWIKVMNKHKFDWLNVFDTGDKVMGGQFGCVGKNILVDEKGIIIGFDLHPLEIEAILESR